MASCPFSRYFSVHLTIEPGHIDPRGVKRKRDLRETQRTMADEQSLLDDVVDECKQEHRALITQLGALDTKANK